MVFFPLGICTIHHQNLCTPVLTYISGTLQTVDSERKTLSCLPFLCCWHCRAPHIAGTLGTSCLHKFWSSGGLCSDHTSRVVSYGVELRDSPGCRLPLMGHSHVLSSQQRKDPWNIHEHLHTGASSFCCGAGKPYNRGREARIFWPTHTFLGSLLPSLVKYAMRFWKCLSISLTINMGFSTRSATRQVLHNRDSPSSKKKCFQSLRVLPHCAFS